ncbi:hypothetical protein ANAEL_01446 [Anaerolineales bacterium]|nr:hypothetical protein ANAEL_01446 [Anaerolineales bacterium]
MKFETLTPEILANIPDSELENILYEFVWTKFESNWNQHVTILSTLPLPAQVIYYTMVLEGEVRNGGFDQYFFNTSQSEESPETTLELLERIGAHEHSRILETAINIHRRNEHDSALYELDYEFYALKENLSNLRIRFVRDNLHVFAMR